MIMLVSIYKPKNICAPSTTIYNIQWELIFQFFALITRFNLTYEIDTYTSIENIYSNFFMRPAQHCQYNAFYHCPKKLLSKNLILALFILF